MFGGKQGGGKIVRERVSECAGDISEKGSRMEWDYEREGVVEGA